MFEAYGLMFRNYFNFKGRTTRAEYWLAILMNVIVTVALSLFTRQVMPDGIGEIVLGIYSLALFIPGLSMNVRRLHDVGRTGWLLVAVYAIQVCAIFICSGSILLLVNGQIEAALRATPWGVVAGLEILDSVLVIWWFVLTLFKSGPDNKWGARRDW